MVQMEPVKVTLPAGVACAPAPRSAEPMKVVLGQPPSPGSARGSPHGTPTQAHVATLRAENWRLRTELANACSVATGAGFLHLGSLPHLLAPADAKTIRSTWKRVPQPDAKVFSSVQSQSTQASAAPDGDTTESNSGTVSRSVSICSSEAEVENMQPQQSPTSARKGRESKTPVKAKELATPRSQPADEQPQGEELRTVYMRNIPSKYTREKLLELIDGRGFRGQYCLAYLPIDFSTKHALGYAFVCFDAHADAVRFSETFHGYNDWAFAGSTKVCNVVWTNGEQTIDALVKRFRNCSVMHSSVPDDFKPALFEGGQRVPFPAPTRTLRKPQTSGGKKR